MGWHPSMGTGGRSPGPAVVWVVEEQSNPSTDYFVGPAVSVLGPKIIKCGPDRVPPAQELAGSVVVFVRYVPALWARAVEAARPSLRGLVYFMDDDLLDWRAWGGMPLRYRFKLARFAAGRRAWLTRLGAEWWVSTPFLKQKYAALAPSLVLPTPMECAPQAVQLFYHGSASHQAEIRWLRPVVEAALSREVRLSFEIIGGQDVYRLYRGLPRVRVVHPMKWPAYRAFMASGERHIGLAPLLEGPFNRARSFTKFLDISGAGAAGIYAAESACAGVVEHGVDGLVLPLSPDVWAEAIVTLARDRALRCSLVRNAAKKMERLAAEAGMAHDSLVL